MPYACVVYGCSNRSNRERNRSFYRVPKVILHKGEKCKETTKKRREIWLANLCLSSGAADSKHARVCSDHFVKGRPRALYDVDDVDWAPTLNLGYQKITEKSEAARLRDERRRTVGVEALLELRELMRHGAENPEPEENSETTASDNSFRRGSHDEQKELTPDAIPTIVTFQSPPEKMKLRRRKRLVGQNEDIMYGFEGSFSSVERKQTPVLRNAGPSAHGVAAPEVSVPLVDSTTFHPSCVHEHYCRPGVNSENSQKGPSPPIQMNLRWEWLGMDLKGPLPKTQDGHTHILTVVDLYSKWVEAYPIKLLSPEAVALNIGYLVCQLGFPQQILSQMDETLIKEVNMALSTYLAVEECSLVVFHPETCTLDPLTQSYIDRMVWELVEEHPRNWNVQLPTSLFSLRCRKHPSTHYSPFYMLYCKEPCVDSTSKELPFLEDHHVNKVHAPRPPPNVQTPGPELSRAHVVEATPLQEPMDVEEVIVVQCEQCSVWDRISQVPTAERKGNLAIKEEDHTYVCADCREKTPRTDLQPKRARTPGVSAKNSLKAPLQNHLTQMVK
ncbi:hypothetical protein AAFF_G00083210 [Aldrovandia affinis]|uniref:THAP-type domain-containing protein n=1 Tax=Aldrovandia affinis TaxID=143900 RepID=A0AAD7RX43_9TELE|nr:hypothetical protein AAFF_G00083210 [Aldrovandia affinis]